MFSEESALSTSFGRGFSVVAAAAAEGGLVSWGLVVPTGPLAESLCCLFAGATSGRAGRRLGKTADGRTLEGPNRLTTFCVCVSRRRFDGCELLWLQLDFRLDIVWRYVSCFSLLGLLSQA